MKIALFLFITFFSLQTFALNLLQEEKEILCQSDRLSILIDARDRYFEVNSKKFKLVEFLDTAILARSESNEYSLIQMLSKNKALVVKGTLVNFTERHCKQVKASKICENENGKIGWAPAWLEKSGSRFPLVHYGVYPNDGTGFIAISGDEGLSLIDFGSKFVVISGQAQRLDCQYKL